MQFKLIFAGAAIVTLMFAPVARAEETGLESIRWSTPQDSLQIAVIFPTQPFDSSMSMPVKIVIKNVGRAPMTLRRPQSPFNFKLSVFRGKEEIEPRPVDNTNRAFSSDGRRDVTLATGAYDTETIFLDSRFRLNAGDYSLRVVLPVKELMPSEGILTAPDSFFAVK